MAKNRRKIASILIILGLLLPFFWTFSYFNNASILGATNRTEASAPKINFNLPNPLGSSLNLPKITDEKAGYIPNKNSDVIGITYTKSRANSGDKDPNRLSEGPDTDVAETVAKRFNTKLIVRNQKQEAVSNTFNPLKTSYDIIYNNNIATVFVISNDPSLKQENAIAINYNMAKRIGINIDKPQAFDVVVQQKK